MNPSFSEYISLKQQTTIDVDQEFYQKALKDGLKASQLELVFFSTTRKIFDMKLIDRQIRTYVLDASVDEIFYCLEIRLNYRYVNETSRARRTRMAKLMVGDWVLSEHHNITALASGNTLDVEQIVLFKTKVKKSFDFMIGTHNAKAVFFENKSELSDVELSIRVPESYTLVTAESYDGNFYENPLDFDAYLERPVSVEVKAKGDFTESLPLNLVDFSKKLFVVMGSFGGCLSGLNVGVIIENGASLKNSDNLKLLYQFNLV